MNQPLTSIIVPSWNGKSYIEACLDSLLGQDYPHFEVIVVDNASTDGSAELIAAQYPTVRLIRNERNVGFAGGVNVGLRAAAGQILVLFNQDASAQPDWLAALVAGLLAAPDIGVAGCKILNVDSQIIQHAGGSLTVPQSQPSHIGLGEIDVGQYEQPADVDYVTGAALAFRRDILETIGYFDEAFFFYYEDVDYCYRARAANFKVLYVPRAVVYHYGNSSLGIATVAHHANFHASRLQFVIKQWGIPYFISQFQPIELAWFRTIPTSEERVGLHQAYQTIITQVARQPSALAGSTQAELLAGLCRLRQQIFAAYLNEAWHSLEQLISMLPQSTKGWWVVEERPFSSHVPVIGPIIAWLRTIWNDVSTKWFVRLILQQQNEVNRILAQRQTIQEQILHNQSQLLQEIDRDQTIVLTQLLEITQQLDRIEARLGSLE